MELKSNLFKDYFGHLRSFNRTFMELKLKKLLLFLLLSISFQSYLYGIEILEQILKDQHHQRVSIVPLWN